MEPASSTMRLKWQRHTSSTLWICSVFFFLIAIVSFALLVVLWPQWLASAVFDSRIFFHHIIDYEDMRTLAPDFRAFVRYEPEPVDDLTNFYIFAVTNANDVVERGVRPRVQETGPFGYRKFVYRYDVRFSADNSNIVTFKQWQRYELVTDSSVCSELYRSFGRRSCTGTKCQCLSDMEEVVVVNPAFIRLIYTESAQAILGLFSEGLFSAVRDWFVQDFITALRQHFAHLALRSIVDFRRNLQSFILLETAHANLVSDHRAVVDLFLQNPAGDPNSCGLNIYGMSTCPWSAANFLSSVPTMANAQNGQVNLTELSTLVLNDLLEVSIVNLDQGAQRWMAVMFSERYFSSGDIDSANLVAATTTALIDELTSLCAYSDRTGVALYVTAVAKYINSRWHPDSTINSMLYNQWLASNHQILPCSLKYDCLWEASQMVGTFEFTYGTFVQIFDFNNAINTNQLSIYYQEYMPTWFDSWEACQAAGASSDALISGMSSTIPSHLYASQTGAAASDFSMLDISTKILYTNVVCDLSNYLYGTLALDEDFLSSYIVDYFNDRISGYTFSVDAIEDLGYAQWTDGSVTLAFMNAPSVFNLRRQGMWDIVPARFGTSLLEYYSWVVVGGYPSMKPTVAEGKKLLTALASDDYTSRELREHIITIGSTYYGNGKDYLNGVGAIGERTFIVENPQGNFSCPGRYSDLCQLADTTFSSAATECTKIVQQYTACQASATTNWWVSECIRFATTANDPNSGIQCTSSSIKGKPHPYDLKRGNVLATIIYSWTLNMLLKRDNMWCESPTSCAFDKGGLFIRTTVRNLLFEGFVDNSVLHYYNVKYKHDNISFVRADSSTSGCESGLTMQLPNGTSVHLQGQRDLDAYHNVRVLEDELGANASFIWNPIFSLFPSQTSNDSTFLKSQACQHRILGGRALSFRSCRNYMYTGAKDTADMNKLVAYYGNTTIAIRSRSLDVRDRYHDLLGNFRAFGWEGFYQFPYSYRFRQDGLLKFGLSEIVAWNPRWLMTTHLTSADSGALKVASQRPISSVSNRSSESMTTHEYVETRTGWDLGQNRLAPLDSYGMPYSVPIGMVSIEDWAHMGAMISTPHQWGNRLWGGPEYSETSGYLPDFLQHRSFVHVDWTSGQVVQGANRKQVNLRMERSPLFPNVVSSQQRCNPPTKAFLGGSGYGCFMYLPLLWIDEQKFISESAFAQYYDHYYQRPERASTIMIAGISLSLISLAFSCACYTRHFLKQRQIRHRVFVE